MRNAGLEETQAGIKIAGRNINNLRYADDTTLMAESEEELKSLLMITPHGGSVGLGLLRCLLTASKWTSTVSRLRRSGTVFFLAAIAFSFPNQLNQNLCRWGPSIGRF